MKTYRYTTYIREIPLLILAVEWILKKTLPSILFNLSPKNPKVLLDRLDKDDPKYQFRSRNIKGGFNAAQSAVDLLPKNLQEIVVDIDCSEDERVIHNRVVRSLGRVGLGSWLKMVDN